MISWVDTFRCPEMTVAQPSAQRIVIAGEDDFEQTAADHVCLCISQSLLFTFVDGDDHAARIHHKHRVRHQVEQRLVPRLRGHELLRPLRHGLFELRRVFLQLSLKPVPFGHVAHKRARVNQPAPLLIDQRRGVNLHVDRVTVLGEKHRLHRTAPLRHQSLQILQYERLLATRHEVPELHRQHLIEGVFQLLEPRLVHMDESAAPVQLIDHLRRMLDQIAVLFFQAVHIHHALFDLRKRSL